MYIIILKWYIYQFSIIIISKNCTECNRFSQNYAKLEFTIFSAYPEIIYYAPTLKIFQTNSFARGKWVYLMRLCLFFSCSHLKFNIFLLEKYWEICRGPIPSASWVPCSQISWNWPLEDAKLPRQGILLHPPPEVHFSQILHQHTRLILLIYEINAHGHKRKLHNIFMRKIPAF